MRCKMGRQCTFSGFAGRAKHDAMSIIRHHRSVKGNIVLRFVVQQRTHSMQHAQADLFIFHGVKKFPIVDENCPRSLRALEVKMKSSWPGCGWTTQEAISAQRSERLRRTFDENRNAMNFDVC